MVVAGLGIMTVMLAAVSERTREIGIKKSIGATKVDIIREFFNRSVRTIPAWQLNRYSSRTQYCLDRMSGAAY